VGPGAAPYGAGNGSTSERCGTRNRK